MFVLSECRVCKQSPVTASVHPPHSAQTPIDPPFDSTETSTLCARLLLLPHRYSVTLGVQQNTSGCCHCSAHMDTHLILLGLQHPVPGCCHPSTPCIQMLSSPCLASTTVLSCSRSLCLHQDRGQYFVIIIF